MSKPEFVYVIYVASTPEKVFKALTDENMSEQYWVGNRALAIPPSALGIEGLDGP